MKKALLTMIALSLLAAPAMAKKAEENPEPPAQVEATHVAVPIDVINAIMQNLQARPYAEVANTLEAYRQTARPIVLEPAPKEE